MASRDSAKVVSFVTRQAQVKDARKVASAFDQKTSKYSRREEEAQISRSQAITGSAAGLVDTAAAPQDSHRHSQTGQKRSRFALNEGVSYLYATDGNALGVKRDDAAGLSEVPTAAAEVGPEAKLAKRDRFEALIDESRQKRLEGQKRRGTLDKRTEELDAEYEAIADLIPKRDYRREAKDAFELSVTPQVRELLLAKTARAAEAAEQVDEATATRGARVFTLGADGNLQAPPPERHATAPSGGGRHAATSGEAMLLSARAAKTEPSKVAAQPAASIAPAATAPPAASPKEEDEFDKMMREFRSDPRRAIAGERTLSPEELEKKLLADQLLALRRQDEGKVIVRQQAEDQTRAEWLARGYQGAHRMDSDDEDDNEAGGGVGGEGAAQEDDGYRESGGTGATATVVARQISNDFDKAMTDAERSIDACIAARNKLLDGGIAPAPALVQAEARSQEALLLRLTRAIHDAASKCPVHAVGVFRALLIDVQAARLTNAAAADTAPPSPISEKHVAFLLIASRLFPRTDFRHPVTSPLIVLLAAAVSNHPMTSPRQAATALTLASLLADIVGTRSAFASEPLACAYNAIGLRLPRRALVAGAAPPFPVPNARPESPDVGGGATPAAPIGTFAPLTCEWKDVVVAAYSLLTACARMLGPQATFTAAIEDPFNWLDAALRSVVVDRAARTATVVSKAHAAAADAIRDLAAACVAARAPLAMRTFRPRPMRMYEPLLELVDPRHVHEHRALKAEVRETKKRLVRHVQAEAAVDRRAQDRTAAAEDERRTANYTKLMAELQQQQHVMKTVDSFMMKSKEKKRKSISGEASKPTDDGDD